mgnify:CR=1 FL=1
MSAPVPDSTGAEAEERPKSPETSGPATVRSSSKARLHPSLGARLAATKELSAPLVAVDLDAFDANAAELLRRGERPLRLATKSVRVPALIERALAAGFEGLMTFSLAEALWWAPRADDVLMGYPTVDRKALAALARDARAREVVTLMVDDRAHLDLVEAALADAPQGLPPVRVCLDIDASLRVGPLHLGVRRSPLRTPEEAVALALEAESRGIEVRGVMFYEAQVAGLPDSSPAVRLVKRASLAELARRRGAVVEALAAELGAIELVNGGGTGSIADTAADPVVTEVTSGSGLLSPTLFDGYRLRPGQRPLTPAAFIGLDVVRRPAEGFVTAFSGGYIASGPTGRSRAPLPVLPAGLRLTGSEGAGEVQTPLRGAAARGVRVGERVWLRHAKAGEVMERFAELALLSGPQGAVVVETVPTYRGEGLAFG